MAVKQVTRLADVSPTARVIALATVRQRRTPRRPPVIVFLWGLMAGVVLGMVVGCSPEDRTRDNCWADCQRLYDGDK